MANHSRLGLLAAVAVALGLTVGSAAADDSHGRMRAHLSGSSEVPSISTTGRGELRLRFEREDDDAQSGGGDVTSIEYTLSYEDLEGTTTLFAHIHLGQPDVNGGVSVFLCGGSTAPACPPTEGTVSGTILAEDVVGPAGQGISPGDFEELIAAIRSRVTYVNVHTNLHPTGEIRGNIR